MNATKLPMFALMLIVITAVGSINVFGDDKTQDDQYAALATTRTQAELACRRSVPALDQNKNGVNDTRNEIAQAHAKTAAIYNKAIQAENAKGDDRNQALIDELSGLNQQQEQDWQTYSRDQEKMNAAYNEAQVKAQTARQVYDSLTNLERSWKDANMDLSVLGADYEQAANTVNAAVADAQKLVTDLKDRQKEWDAKVDAASKKTGIK